MRFIDFNGSGGIDPQDIATSVAVEEAAEHRDDSDEAGGLQANPGCAAMTALALAIAATLTILSAL